MRTSYVTTTPTGGPTLASRGHATAVAVSSGEPEAVHRAARDLTRDLQSVTGGSVALVEADDLDEEAVRGTPVRTVVGTIGRSPLIDAAIAAGRLDVTGLLDDSGALRWEGFTVQVVDDLLFVAGADRRGTVFGIYDLCEQAGVSPWTWWADVPVREGDHVAVRQDTAVVDWPSVPYRGIFLNDEEELEDWARAHTGDDTIGPETYARVFELVLRLKGNYVWPAMHVSAFNHDPANGRLAHDMGIVIGTSHCDMLLRSNEHEFAPWAATRETPVEYDYSIPGRNRDELIDYWRGSVRQNGAYEVSWTVGMRAIHDSGFATAAIDADESLSEDQKHTARVDLLGQVIADQRELLASELGERGRDCLQLFIPYKEVLPLYDAGLAVPDDVTIVWANDSFGYVRRYPTGAELDRSGGHGLYYHSSYWSMPPRSYLATSSTPLALMRHELDKSWDHGIRRLWVDNVGGIKPLELETEYFLRHAWEAGKEDFRTTRDVTAFTAAWVDQQFSGGHGRCVADILDDFYQLNQQRKIEHLAGHAFPQTGYGDEAGRRLAMLRDLYDRVNDVWKNLPETERDAFVQLVLVKVHLTYLVNAQFYHADRSTLSHAQGKLPAADRHLELSRTFEAHKRALLHHYDRVMADGRWQHMFTPESFPPPVMPLHPAGKPALQIGAGGLGVLTQGEDGPVDRPRLTFWPYGTTTQWIEVFATGAPGATFRVTADEWIDLSTTSGTVETETRIQVRVHDPLTHADRSGAVVVHDDGGRQIEVAVDVIDPPRPEAGFCGTVEADGYLSIEAAHPDSRHDGRDTAWRPVPMLGRSGGPAVEATGRARPGTDLAEQATLSYTVHVATPGAHLLELHRLPTLDATGRIRVAVGVDDAPAVVVESPTVDEHRGDWTETVLDNVERLTLRLPYLTVGTHTLHVHAIDEHVTLTRLVVYTLGRRPTNLGPLPSHHTARPRVDVVDPDPVEAGLEALESVATDIYRTDPASVPWPGVVYTDAAFWDTPTTFKRNVVVPQEHLGAARYGTEPDGTKDLIAALGEGVVTESDGRLALEAEYALAESPDAWTTPGIDDGLRWTHTQAETDGRTGLAMHLAARGRQWEVPAHAPGLHYRVDVATPGVFHAWLLVRFEDTEDDSCVLAVDGTPQPVTEQFCGGDLYSFGTQHIWFWTHLSDLELTTGQHVLSVLGRRSGLRIDRLYLTTGDERPPVDAGWQPSPRVQRAAR